MSDLKKIEKIKLERYFDMGYGYVLDFSNRSFEEFVLEYVEIDIYEKKYSIRGDSKANRLRTLWDIEPNNVVADLINYLIEYKKESNLTNKKGLTPNDDIDSEKTVLNIVKHLRDEEVRSYHKSVPMVSQATDNKKEHDVFLCHNSLDKPEVITVCEALNKRDISCWLDIYELQPGKPWQPELERQIKNINSVAVFIGESGLGPWHDIELNAFIREFVKRNCTVIPVLLKGCNNEPELPTFLSGMTFVNFNKPFPSPLEQLIWGITGKNPNKPSSLSTSKQNNLFNIPESELNTEETSKNDIYKYDANHIHEQEAKRDIEKNNHLEFIKILPTEKQIELENAHKKWDTGISYKMREANSEFIVFLEKIWLKLAEFYTSKNFDGKNPEQYISEFIGSRSEYHHSKHTLNGKFLGGSDTRTMIGNDVISDLNEIIKDMVFTFSIYNDDFNYGKWIEKWAWFKTAPF